MIANLYVISGPSGVGKDTLMAFIFKSIPSLKRWVTCTTRKPREGEVDGVDYFFKSKEEFKQMINNNELVEWNEFANNYYGTPKKFVDENLVKGISIIAAIDVNGAMNVKKCYPNSKLIFIEPPSIEELRNRLKIRGSENSDVIEQRINIANDELSVKNKFDISVVNDNLEKASKKIISYIQSN